MFALYTINVLYILFRIIINIKLFYICISLFKNYLYLCKGLEKKALVFT